MADFPTSDAVTGQRLQRERDLVSLRERLAQAMQEIIALRAENGRLQAELRAEPLDKQAQRALMAEVERLKAGL